MPILKRGHKYKTRDGHVAVITSHTSPIVLRYGGTDDKTTDYYAYGHIELKTSKRELVWQTSTGNRIYSKAPKPNPHDIVSEI